MQKIKIETAQNVNIEYDVASVGERILAYLLDYIILISYFVAIILVYVLFEKILTPYVIAYFTVLSLPAVLYDLLCEIFLEGQSVGKKVLKIKVVKVDGTQPSVGSYILRYVFRIIDISLSYGAVAILTIVINGKGRRVGDLVAGTSVISLKQRVSMKDTILTHVDENYRPVFPEAKKLDDRIITIVKDALSFKAHNGLTDASLLVLEKTKDAVSKKLGIKSAMNAEEFLSSVLRDYTYYSMRE